MTAPFFFRDRAKLSIDRDILEKYVLVVPSYCPACDSVCCDLTPAWCPLCEGWRHGIEGYCTARRWTSRNRFTSSRCAYPLRERLVPGLDVAVAYEVGFRALGWARTDRFAGRVLGVSGPFAPFGAAPLHVVVVDRAGEPLSVSAGYVRPSFAAVAA